jgi:hypothetical protein
MEKRCCYPAEKILEIQSRSRFSKCIISAVLQFLKRYFESELLIEIPRGLQSYDLDMIKLIKLLSQSQSYWNFSIKKNKLPKKEPFIFCFQGTFGDKILSIEGDFFSEKIAFEKCILQIIPKMISKDTSGIFIGKSLQEAKVRGILEIVAEKYFLLGMQKKRKLSKINLDCLIGQDDDIVKVIKRFSGNDLKFNLYPLPSSLPIYLFLTTIEGNKSDRSDSCFGLGCALDIKTAILESISRALSKRIFAIENNCNNKEMEMTDEINQTANDFSVDVNLFENQYFFETLKNYTDSSEYYGKTLDYLTRELEKQDIKIIHRKIKSRKLQKLNLFGVESYAKYPGKN